MILGGDYSLWDSILDWKNHTWSYAFIKVSEGIIEDPMFQKQWQASYGRVYRGGYHFFRPLVNWRLSTEKFMQLMVREKLGELPPVLDLEVTNGVSNAKICEDGLEWLRFIHRESGQRPMVYTGPGFANSIYLWRYPDYADYPLWEAVYPFDLTGPTWSEEQRSNRIHDIIMGSYAYTFPVAVRPWQDVGRRATFVQWTGKCPPEYVPGYPLGGKLAVDVNFYRNNLQDMKIQFNLPELEGGTVVTKPIEWKATLKDGQKANLRNAPGLSGTSIWETLVGPLPLQGTGSKVFKDNYWWGELVLPKSGWVAFTTSITIPEWITPQPSKKVVKSTLEFSDGTTEELFPKQT